LQRNWFPDPIGGLFSYQVICRLSILWNII
jgi:hypothetical protein